MGEQAPDKSRGRRLKIGERSFATSSAEVTRRAAGGKTSYSKPARPRVLAGVRGIRRAQGAHEHEAKEHDHERPWNATRVAPVTGTAFQTRDGKDELAGRQGFENGETCFSNLVMARDFWS